MSGPDWSPEKTEVERIAQDYRERGYAVTIDPSVSELPDFVHEYRPDIIARSAKESVVIEVRSVHNDSDSQRLKAMAQRVESRPGWRFVFVAPAPRERLLPGESLEPAR